MQLPVRLEGMLAAVFHSVLNTGSCSFQLGRTELQSSDSSPRYPRGSGCWELWGKLRLISDSREVLQNCPNQNLGGSFVTKQKLQPSRARALNE